MYAEKLLPHDVNAEEEVIGALLIDGDSVLRVAPLIKPDDFYREKNRLCFAACLSLFQRSEGIDQVTVAWELGRDGHLDAVGGMAYLSHLVAITPAAAHAEHYAQVVSRTATMRRLIEAASRISAIGYEDTQDIEAALRRAEDTLFQVRSGQRERDFVPLRQVYDQYRLVLREAVLLIQGVVSRREGTMNVVARQVRSLKGVKDSPRSKDWR